jgi:hypothetical protein
MAGGLGTAPVMIVEFGDAGMTVGGAVIDVGDAVIAVGAGAMVDLLMRGATVGRLLVGATSFGSVVASLNILLLSRCRIVKVLGAVAAGSAGAVDGVVTEGGVVTADGVVVTVDGVVRGPVTGAWVRTGAAV